MSTSCIMFYHAGVFCQSAMESAALGSSCACAWIDGVSNASCVQHSGAEKDHELVLQNVVQEKAKYFRAVRRLFAQTLGFTIMKKASPPSATAIGAD